MGAKGRGAARADPFRAALVALLLLGEALAQGFHQLFETQRLQLGLFGVRQVFFRELAQPSLRNFGPKVHAGSIG